MCLITYIYRPHIKSPQKTKKKKRKKKRSQKLQHQLEQLTLWIWTKQDVSSNHPLLHNLNADFSHGCFIALRLIIVLTICMGGHFALDLIVVNHHLQRTFRKTEDASVHHKRLQNLYSKNQYFPKKFEGNFFEENIIMCYKAIRVTKLANLNGDGRKVLIAASNQFIIQFQNFRIQFLIISKTVNIAFFEKAKIKTSVPQQ